MALPTGGLTPRSNNKEKAYRYSGGFGQSDGFASILDVKVNTAGELTLTLHYKMTTDRESQFWSVMLSNEQRKHLAALLDSYDPTLWEEI